MRRGLRHAVGLTAIGPDNRLVPAPVGPRHTHCSLPTNGLHLMTLPFPFSVYYDDCSLLLLLLTAFHCPPQTFSPALPTVVPTYRLPLWISVGVLSLDSESSHRLRVLRVPRDLLCPQQCPYPLPCPPPPHTQFQLILLRVLKGCSCFHDLDWVANTPSPHHTVLFFE